jgi:uncharacterized membrane protein
MDLGRFHVLVLHFPIALSLAAALADVLWTIRRKDFYRHAGFYCLLLAAIGAIPTVITGELHLEGEHHNPEVAAVAETHEALGISTLCVLLAAAGLRAVRKNRPRGWWLRGYVVLMAAAVVLVSLTAHYGGMITFGPH